MKKLLLSAAMILSADMALASITAEQLVAAYQAKGYTNIEATAGPTQIKVEASRANSRLEAVYDIATGAVLQQERSGAVPGSDTLGAKVKTVKADFVTERASEDSALDQQGQDGPNDGQNDSSDDNSNDGHEDTQSGQSGDHDGGQSGHDGSDSDSGSDDNG
ncbi:MAG: hypothetical protein ACOH2H_14750 [Cypionkella sp.]